jgi:hypothetical protein
MYIYRPDSYFWVYKMRALLILTISSFLIVACGGGGGGQSFTPTNPDAVFSTSDPDVDEPGETKTLNLAGTASADGYTENITGSITVSRKPDETLNSEPVSVSDLVFVVSFPSSGTTIAQGSTTYATLAGEIVQEVGDDGVICYPDSNWSALPATVQYGDAGVLGSGSCTDGTTSSASYVVEVSSRNNAWAAIRVFATYSEPGQDDYYEDTVYHVSEDGRTRAFDIKAGDATVILELGS